MTVPDPLSVICPFCGALPGERCEAAKARSLYRRYYGDKVADLDFTHKARGDEARRVQGLNAEPTRPL